MRHTVDLLFARRPSRQFAFGLAAFVVGVFVGPFFDSAWRVLGVWGELLMGAAVVAVATACWVKHMTWRVVVLLVAGVVLGVWRYAAVSTPVVPVDGSMHQYEAVVRGEVQATDHGVRVTMQDIRQGDQEVPGRILVWHHSADRLEDGDEISFSCRLVRPEPFDGFAYDRYLAAHGITALCFRPSSVVVIPRASPTVIAKLLRVKHALVSRLEASLPEPYASFTAGLLFGGDTGLSEGTRETFVRTGTSHILAASGFNVSLFSLVFLGWATRTSLGRRKGIVATALLVGAFVICAGATAAVMRAAVMAWFALLGLYLRREPSVPVAILFSAAILLSVNPLLLADDIGFQLSFAATAGVLFVAPRWRDAWTFVPDIPGWRETVAGTAAAMLLTLPLTFWHFGAISLAAPFVNILILPLVPVLMVASLVALLVSSLLPVLGPFMAVPAWAIASVILRVIVLFSALPEASISVPAAHVLAVLATTVIVFGWRVSLKPIRS